MKPAKFEYFAPESLPEALELLGQYGADAKLLAGGQSLMPLMNMRLVRPGVVIDINGIEDLSFISPAQDGGLAIGALTRQREVERSSLVQQRIPLLAAAMPFIGHFQIRNRGTVGGSIAHGDPAAEIPALSLALDAEFVVTGDGGQRVISAEEFFLAHLTTALRPGEILTQIRVPASVGQSAGGGWGFQEICRREGDFALAGAVTILQLGEDGVCRAGRIAMFGVAATPVRMRKAEDMLAGRSVDSNAREEVAAAVAEELDPVSDIHASARYRKEVGGVLVRRALEQALAGGKGDAGL